MTKLVCSLCESSLSFSWTDHHGIAQCVHCGAPYTVFHYDAENRRIEKPPELLLTEDLERARRFHADTKRKLSAVGMGLSFPGGYDVAGQEDCDAYAEWSESQLRPENDDSGCVSNVSPADFENSNGA